MQAERRFVRLTSEAEQTQQVGWFSFKLKQVGHLFHRWRRLCVIVGLVEQVCHTNR